MVRNARLLVSRASSEEALLGEICALAVGDGSYQLAAIGLGTQGSFELTSSRGEDDQCRSFLRAILAGALVDPATACARSGKPFIARDLSGPDLASVREELTQRGYASMACLPLRIEGEVLGVLMLFAEDPGAFDSEEQVELLVDLGDHLAFGLQALRAEVRRRRLESSLERQLGEHKRREAEYRTILQTSIDGFAMVDEGGRFVDVNDAFCGMTGYGREELLDMHVSDLPAPEHRADPLLGGKTNRTRIRHRRRDGARVDLEVSATFIGPHGNRLAAFLRDVTEETRSAEALRSAQERLYRVLGSAPVGLIAMDAAGTITLAEGHALKALGPDCAGRSAFDLFKEDPASPKAVQRALGGEASTALVRTAGHVLEAHLTAMRAPDGTVVGASCVAIDVTEREEAATALRRTEEQSRLYQEQFLQAQKLEAVGRLAGGVAHDFNNLLCAINGYADLLVSELPAEDVRREDAAEIARAGHRAAALTRQLLLFSRRERPVLVTLDLAEAIGGVSQMLRRLIGEDVLLLADLAPAPVRADRGQLEQMVVNLVVNARDAMPGGGTLTISTGVSSGQLPSASDQKASLAILRVADTGCGMSEEVEAHLFEPFFTTKERGKGTGLGLATVYGIVQQLEGRIEVETEVGEGTTFTVLLPLAPVESTQEVSQVVPAAPLHASGTVLVVEDDAVVRRLVLKVLRERGYEVLEATEGAEAIRLCRDHPGQLDVMLTDVVMPGMTGGEVARAVARLRPTVKVLFMSGHAEDVLARRELDSAPGPFLQKPFTPETLAHAIGDLLRQPDPG
ncbi:MAG TPA: PAS domain S-box protein [Anaeromyxobacteraceae bacterium]|nr:PAS domain S-box protein [Anaeromyxobacteraceae bacterium]